MINGAIIFCHFSQRIIWLELLRLLRGEPILLELGDYSCLNGAEGIIVTIVFKG